MNERGQGKKPIRIEDIPKQVYRAQQSERRFIKNFLNPGLEPYVNLLGDNMFGEQQGGWTVDQLMESWNVAEGKEEADARVELTKQVFQIIDAQNSALNASESTFYPIALEVHELTLAILERVISSPRRVTILYADPSEALNEAYTTERIRQLVLQPAYPLIGRYLQDLRPAEVRNNPFSINRDDYVDALELQRMEEAKARMKDPENMDAYSSAHNEMLAQRLEEYTVEEWEGLVGDEGEILLGHIKNSAERSLQKYEEEFDFMQRLTHQGERLPDEIMEKLAQLVNMQRVLTERVRELTGFMDIVPFIKDYFGNQASYATLLQALHFVKEVEKDDKSKSPDGEK